MPVESAEAAFGVSVGFYQIRTRQCPEPSAPELPTGQVTMLAHLAESPAHGGCAFAGVQMLFLILQGFPSFIWEAAELH